LALSFLPNAVFPSDTSTKYDIVFKENSDLDTKKSTETIRKQQSVVIIDPKSGIKYSCILPELLTPEEKLNTPEEKSIENEPLKKGSQCILRDEGWWKYEFCYGKYIRQFHIDAQDSKVTEFFLGRFDQEQSVINTIVDSDEGNGNQDKEDLKEKKYIDKQ